MSRPLFVVLVSLACGCSLARSPIVSSEPVDGGAPDAAEPDGGGLDADLDGGDLDGGLDAPSPPDAGEDAPTCAPETCNGLDDDCNGSVDDGAVCRACTEPGTCADCVRFEAGGHVYQSCPGVGPLVYWQRICGTLGGGWEMAVPDDATESDAIAAGLRSTAGIGVTHWIGVNDFETNGTYVTIAGTPLGWTPAFSDFGAPRDNEGWIGLRTDGQWDDFPLLGFIHRSLCELDTARRCRTSAADDATCDQIDDDCDGFVDEDCTGTASCEARVYWDSVFYVCTDDMTSDEAKEACTALGADLTVLEDRFQLAFADVFASADAWVGLYQDPLGAEPNDGWAWAGGMPFLPADPEWGSLWDFGQPSMMAAEDCAFIEDSTNRLQDNACGMNRTATICEAPLR